MAGRSPDKKTYYRVAAALTGLLVLTVAASFVPLGRFGIVVALTIAFAKAMVIALYFMHVKYSSRLTILFAAASLYWLLILFGLTFGDYVMRT